MLNLNVLLLAELLLNFVQFGIKFLYFLIILNFNSLKIRYC